MKLKNPSLKDYSYIIDALVVSDKEGKILLFNEKAQEIFGRSEEEALGKNVSILMCSPFRDVHQNFIKSYNQTKRKKMIGIPRQLKGMRKDGTVFPLEISLGELPETENGARFVAVIRDVSRNITSASRYENDFEELETLGRGGFGTCYKVKNRLDNNLYAVKKIRLSKSISYGSSFDSDSSGDRSTDSLPCKDKEKLREAATLATITAHENVVRYYTSWIEAVMTEKLGSLESPNDNQFSTFESTMFSSFDTNSNVDPMNIDMSDDSLNSQISSYDYGLKALVLYIQMEYCDGMTLKDFLFNPNREVNYEKNLQILHQIAKGLNHIHSSGYIHRDLKPCNIFLCNNGTVKIGDFGLATQIENAPSTKTAGVGTAMYAAPEQLISNNYDNKVDVFAFGMIMAELFCPPFKSPVDRYNALTAIRAGKLPQQLLNEYPSLCKIIQNMLSLNPFERMSMNDFLLKYIEKQIFKKNFGIGFSSENDCNICEKKNRLITELLTILQEKEECIKRLESMIKSK